MEPAMQDDAGPDAPRAKPADPCIMVIFGGAGDLTKRLLVPALCNLIEAKLLPDTFAIVGVAHTEMDIGAYRQRLSDAIRDFAPGVAPETAQWLLKRSSYIQGGFDEPETYEKLRSSLGEITAAHGTSNYLFYLATPPDYFVKIVRRLGKAELGEDQIYRIDHYLGKETVQNILIFRFGNGIFEPIWNRQHIDHVQITAAETVGVETRGNFYDATGALRDMVPNHIFQLLAMMAMEAPNSFGADAVRGEKSKVLDAIHRFTPEVAARNVIRGQYAAGV